MSGVVLRCPSCGTTRATPGECEACHDAEVRYFCSNHSPGVWLDASTCTRCGARFGEPAPEAPRPAPVPAKRRRVRDARMPAGPRGPEESVAATRAGETRPPEPEIGSSVPDWREEVLRRRRAAHDAAEPPFETHPAATGLRAAGCLLRLVMILAFLFLAATFGLAMFAGSVFRIF